MKRFVLILMLLVATVSTKVSAQTYDMAVGANLGPSMGITLKKFISSRSAIEGIFAYNLECDAPNFSVLYEYHIPLANRFNMLMGGGVNIGAQHVGRHKKSADFMFGISPIIGLEYTIPSAPVSLGFDYKPAINFAGHAFWDDFAFKVRYTF
ncbi:MAG: hypothetical protein ACRC9Q_05660 [Bacteroidales bacterium]